MSCVKALIHPHMKFDEVEQSSMIIGIIIRFT